jgi:hypothetical protein
VFYIKAKSFRSSPVSGRNVLGKKDKDPELGTLSSPIAMQVTNQQRIRWAQLPQTKKKKKKKEVSF